MKAIAINPTVINVIPMPLKGLGTSLYSSFSRIAARQTIAISQPTPEPSAKETASPKFLIACVFEGSISILCCINKDPPIIAQFTAMSGRKMPNEP